MKHIFNKIWPKKEGKNDFSEFFNNASAEEKKKLFKEVIREANKDQKDLMATYEKTLTKAA